VRRSFKPLGTKWRECDSCDALWSDARPSLLGIKVADCLPISIIAGDAIANIHCGWRGAVQKIVDAALDAIAITADARPGRGRVFASAALKSAKRLPRSSKMPSSIARVRSHTSTTVVTKERRTTYEGGEVRDDHEMRNLGRFNDLHFGRR
jgi:hypothetical protein